MSPPAFNWLLYTKENDFVNLNFVRFLLIIKIMTFSLRILNFNGSSIIIIFWCKWKTTLETCCTKVKMGAIQTKTDLHSLLVISCLIVDLEHVINFIRGVITRLRKRQIDSGSQTEMICTTTNIINVCEWVSVGSFMWDYERFRNLYFLK